MVELKPFVIVDSYSLNESLTPTEGILEIQ